MAFHVLVYRYEATHSLIHDLPDHLTWLCNQ